MRIKYLKRLTVVMLFMPLFSSMGFCEEGYTLDTIVVKANGGEDCERTDSIKQNYTFQSLSNPEIRENNLNSVVDVLDYVSGMDLRYRSHNGVQGDLSVRGSTYEHVAVLIDGIKINDPQTGHYNLDIPLTSFDVERVEVMKEPGSALYGPGAFAGSVNIITKKPLKKSLKLDTVAGEHALFGQAFSVSVPQEDFSGRLSFDHKISKAARPNTDFDNYTSSLYLNRKFDNKEVDALFGYQKKDYGADSFYSNLFSEEEEHTRTLFVKTGLNIADDFSSSKSNVFLRRHDDKFVLNRNNPTSVNYHTNYTYGLNSDFNLPVKYGDLLFGGDLGRDEINSTNLGKHNRWHRAGSIGFVPEGLGKASLDSRLRFDYYQGWDWHESFNLGAGYYIVDQKLKAKCSLARAFKIPSFTELYYSDSANKGNASLKAEKTDSLSAGLNLVEDFITLDIAGFYRRGKNLIDWTRLSTSEAWNATNLGKVDYRGIELSAAIQPDLKLKFFNLKSAVFSYNYTSADKKPNGFLSKYALDILKHQYIADLKSKLLGLNFNWQLSYSERYYGEKYFLGNTYISRKFDKHNFSWEPYLKIDNFSNTKYTQIVGVLEPGRWIKGGLKFEW